MILVVVTCFAVASNAGSVVGAFASCIHGGTKYKDGDYFPPNDTIIQTESPEQCVQCRCQQGLVVCEIENCPPLDCETPVQHFQFCCQRCPKIEEKPSNFIFGQTSLSPKLKSKTDCLSSGRRFEDGSVWQPVIGPFGVMACVRCRCQGGNVVCNRLRCKDLPCLHPKREFGQCCPVCPNSELKRKIEAFCLPQTSELFVFKTPNVRNGTEAIEYAFLENEAKDEMAKVHAWDWRAKNSMNILTVKLVPRKDFYKRNWQILGATTRKRYRKYLKREKRLRGNCLLKCLEKIKRLENSLEVYAAILKKKCADDEVDVSDI